MELLPKVWTSGDRSTESRGTQIHRTEPLSRDSLSNHPKTHRNEVRAWFLQLRVTHATADVPEASLPDNKDQRRTATTTTTTTIMEPAFSPDLCTHTAPGLRGAQRRGGSAASPSGRWGH